MPITDFSTMDEESRIMAAIHRVRSLDVRETMTEIMQSLSPRDCHTVVRRVWRDHIQSSQVVQTERLLPECLIAKLGVVGAIEVFWREVAEVNPPKAEEFLNSKPVRATPADRLRAYTESLQVRRALNTELLLFETLEKIPLWTFDKVIDKLFATVKDEDLREVFLDCTKSTLPYYLLQYYTPAEAYALLLSTLQICYEFGKAAYNHLRSHPQVWAADYYFADHGVTQ